jgi:chemotaxis protein methyltransferase CheR
MTTCTTMSSPPRSSVSATSGDPLRDIMRLVHELIGVELADAKRPMAIARLGKRLRQLGLEIADYARLVRNDRLEQVALIDLMTTNHTAWWRESTHFIDLQKRLLPEVLTRAAAHGHPPRLRIWCAAAATGEEPYSIALCIHKVMGHLPALDAAVLATDISTQALAKARAGNYSAERIAGLDQSDRMLALQSEGAGTRRRWVVRNELRRLVQFARLNLIDEWSMRGPFDAIFCRNVMIYFDKATQARLVARLLKLLRPGGSLYVGHAESLANIGIRLRQAGPSIHLAP